MAESASRVAEPSAVADGLSSPGKRSISG